MISKCVNDVTLLNNSVKIHLLQSPNLVPLIFINKTHTNEREQGNQPRSENGDQWIAEHLIKTLKMKEGHADWAEMQRAQIEQMGLESYLAGQTGS